MLFNSAVFIFLFLPIVYVVFWALRSKNARYAWLAFTGYIFYGYWNPAFCLLMATSTLVSYLAGLAFLQWGERKRARKWLLVAPIVVDLCLLGYFKYADFGLGTLNTMLGWVGREPLPLMHFILPIGISFYTFHTISYIVDSYRGVIKPTRNLLEFTCYVSLFSQLVAGPIVRFRELESDLENIDGKSRRNFLDIGWSFFVIGLIQKVLFADTIASIIDPALKDVGALSTISAWLCVLGYSYQLYFDFAGYSNMAVGLGFLFGLHIPQNFDSPYRALNPADFWRRWHISLSRCFRDYVFYPLCGRRTTRRRLLAATFATMALCGLWHGANWTFVFWGAYHGMLLVLYLQYGRIWDARPPWLQRSAMFLLVVAGWTVFRSASLSDAAALLGRLVVPHGGVEMVGTGVLVGVLAIAAAFAHFGPNSFEIDHNWKPRTAFALTLLVVCCLVRIYGAESSPFLYFQF
jgi:alginate O-acetyltransferase complex protein AlgI